MIERIFSRTEQRPARPLENRGFVRPLAARLGFIAATAASALPIISCTNTPSEICKSSSGPSGANTIKDLQSSPSSIKETDLASGVKVTWATASPVLNCDGSIDNMSLTVHWPTGNKTYTPEAGNRFIIEETFQTAMSSAVTGDLTYYNPNSGRTETLPNAATLWPFAVEKNGGSYSPGCYDGNPRIEGNIEFSISQNELKEGDTPTVSVPKSMVRSCQVDGKISGSFRLDAVDIPLIDNATTYAANLPALSAGNHVLYFFAAETTVKNTAPAMISAYFSVQEKEKTACDYDPNPKIQGNIAIDKDPTNIYVGDDVIFSIPQSNIVTCSQELVVTYRVNNEDHPATLENGFYTYQHTFSAPGDQKVFLFAEDPTLNNPTPPNISISLYVKEVASGVEAPLAGLSGPTYAYSDQEVKFEAANPDEQTYSYNWEYSDGSGDIGPISSHIFSLPNNIMATYKVKLVVARLDDPTVKDSAEQQITVIPVTTATPLVGISAPPSATAGQPVALTALWSDPQLFSYRWEFPDNDNLDGASVEKTFADTGNMQTIIFRLVVANLSDPNIKASTEQTITIIPPAVTLPLAGISAPASAVSGQAVNISALNPDAASNDYNWNFSDGSSDFGADISKVFTLPASTIQTIKIQLTVARKNNPQIKDTADQFITLVAPTVTPLQLSANIPDWAHANDNVNMTVLNPDTANWNYAWNFGDNQTAAGAAVSHSYPNVNDKYTVLLSATSKTDPNLQYFLTDYIKIVP